jgi:hypothetical protein
MNYTELRENLSKFYSRNRIKAYKISSGIKSKSYSTGKNIKNAVPKNKTEFLELLDTVKYKIKNFPKRYEKPIPEADGDLDVKFRHNWDEEANINNSDELYFEAINRKAIESKDTVYTFNILCTQDKQDLELKRDYLDLYDDNKDVERQYHKDTTYDIYTRIEVLHVNNKEDADHELLTTQIAQLENQATGIRALESKLNELIKKYEQDYLEMWIRELQNRGELYVDNDTE